MNIIIVIVVLAALGLLGIVTKSIIAVLFGAIGLAVSFVVFCTGTLLSVLWNVIAFVIGLILILAAIAFIPALLIVIIPGIIFTYWYARKKGFTGYAGSIQNGKGLESRNSV